MIDDMQWNAKPCSALLQGGAKQGMHMLGQPSRKVVSHIQPEDSMEIFADESSPIDRFRSKTMTNTFFYWGCYEYFHKFVYFVYLYTLNFFLFKQV